MAVFNDQADPFNLDALAVSDRFRPFGFTRRDDYVAYLWVLRAMDRLRGAHVAQAHTDDVAEVLAELAAAHNSVPRNMISRRGRLDNLTDDGVLHRLEDASRAGSLARYRNRQSVYQFSELGHRAYTAVEGVLAARVHDVNLSRLVFSDILRDLQGLAEANRAGDGDEIVRRLTSLDRVMEDMARRSARFHLTLGDITRSTEASPEMFVRYKHALLAHMSDFMAELDRYLPRLALAVTQVEATGLGTLLNRAAEADERPLMRADDVLDDWRRRWAAVRAWFTAEGEGSRAAELAAATRAGVSSVIALLRQITEAQRGGVNCPAPGATSATCSRKRTPWPATGTSWAAPSTGTSGRWPRRRPPRVCCATASPRTPGPTWRSPPRPGLPQGATTWPRSAAGLSQRARPSRPAVSPRRSWARPGRSWRTATGPAGRRSSGWTPSAPTWPGSSAAGPTAGLVTSHRRSSTAVR
ncbi:MAG TPA: DUF2397 family protein [Streptosporangiaceae bacterium]|nr:DUF2397 family protein [Streptosporangiaceae bacterium]